MRYVDRRNALKSLAGTACVMALPHSIGDAAEPAREERGAGSDAGLVVPESLKAEHDELHEELVRATKAGGETGEAAKAVAMVLHPHFIKEEELAMPPLGLLPALADGKIGPEMAKVVELTDKLKRELPAMLKEHEAIVGALRTLAEAAKREKRLQVEQFAEKLMRHAKVEEEITYPAAILVGEYVKLKLER